MAEAQQAEKPKSRLPNGRVNPAYTAWRKANKEQPEAAPVPESLTLRAVKPANNDRYVLCGHPTERGKTLAVRLLKCGTAGKMLKKPVRVQIRDGKAYQVR